MNIGKIARIVRLREEQQKKRAELEGLVAQYIELNRDPKRPVPWRKLAWRIGMDHMQLYRIAKSRGLVADKEQESATDMTEEAV